MTRPAAERFWNVPNSLTMSRLALSGVILVLLEVGWHAAAFGVFVVAAATDWFDGYFARRLNQSSALGRQLDPLVDKIMVIALYVDLVAIPGTGVKAWMVNVIVARDFLIQGLRSHLEGRGQPFGAKFAGKLKTFVQCLSIGACLLFLAIDPPAPWLWLRDGLTWAAVGLTIYSGVGYVASGMKMLRT